MIYFLIVGIFLLPFILNTINCIIPKEKLWLKPSFFLIIILGLFQLLLSWFTTANIHNYLAFSILSYLILAFIILFLIIFSLAKIISNWEFVNFRKIVKANYSSLVFAILMAIPLIVIAANNSLIIFSDTQGYINISSYFSGNGIYAFDGINNLDYTYRIPVGYYLNSVFSNINFSLAYRFLWVATIFYIFNWAIYYLITQKLIFLKNITQLFLSAFFSLVYACISFVSIYIFSGGNLEMQSLLVVVCFVLIYTKNVKYFFITCFAFLLFSSTTLILSCGILLIGFSYLLFKGNRIQFISLIFAITSFLVIGVSFGLSAMGKHVYITPYFGVISLLIMLALFALLVVCQKNSRLNYLLNKKIIDNNLKVKILTTLGLSFNHKLKIKSRLLLNKINKILLIIFYLLTTVAVFLISQFIVTIYASVPSNISYTSLGIMALITTLAIYLLFAKNQVSKLMFWSCFFNVAFIIVSLFFHFYDDLFVNNLSSWRIIYLTMSIGNFSTYVSIVVILICEIIDANKLFFLNLLKPVIRTKKIHKNRLIFYYSTFAIGLTTIVLSSSASATAWSIRNVAAIKKVGGDTSVLNSSWSPNYADKKIFSIINKLNETKDNLPQLTNKNLLSNKVASNKTNLITNQKSSSTPSFYFYTDLALAPFLNNLLPLSYMPYYVSTICDNFIKSDIRLTTVESKTANELLYYNLPNTIANVNKIIDLSIDNIQDSNNINIPPSINVSGFSSDINTPISNDAISVSGAPQLIILNKNTSYFKELSLTKNLHKSGDIYYGDSGIGSLGPNPVGYEFIYETKNTAFYVESSLTEFINQFKNIVINLPN